MHSTAVSNARIYLRKNANLRDAERALGAGRAMRGLGAVRGAVPGAVGRAPGAAGRAAGSEERVIT